MQRTLFALLAAASLTACAAPDANMFIGFEDEALGQLPSTDPAGQPVGDAITIAGPPEIYPNVQVAGAPMDTTGLPPELVAALRNIDGQALYIPNAASGSLWFASRRIPSDQRSRKQIATFNGFLAGPDAEVQVTMSGLVIGSESPWVRMTISPDEVTSSLVGPSEDSALQFSSSTTVPVTSDPFFDVRATFDPGPETVDLAITVGRQTVRSTGSYAGGGALNGIIVFVTSGEGDNGGVFVDDFKLQPPLRISLSGVSGGS